MLLNLLFGKGIVRCDNDFTWGRCVRVIGGTGAVVFGGLLMACRELLLLVAVVFDQLGALDADNGRVRCETAGESWQCKGTSLGRAPPESARNSPTSGNADVVRDSSASCRRPELHSPGLPVACFNTPGCHKNFPVPGVLSQQHQFCCCCSSRS